MLNLPHSPATRRNREPIFDVLKDRLREGSSILEIASGTGEHASWMASKVPLVTWQPSDVLPERLSTIDSYNVHNSNVLPAIHLDVLGEWPTNVYDTILCINMIHISPWECCQALLQQSRSHLSSNGLLYLYGPYKKGGQHTSESNNVFDSYLRNQNPCWGVRNMETVIEEAEKSGFIFHKSIAMPANNFSLLFTC